MKIIIELEVLKVNGIRTKEIENTAGFKKGTTAIIENLCKQLPKHFKTFRMETKATGYIEESKKDG